MNKPVKGDHISRNFAVDNSTSIFDKILPEIIGIPNKNPTMIIYKNVSGIEQVLKLKKNNKYHLSILKGCYFGIHSDWFFGLTDSSKRTYLKDIKNLFDWINKTNQVTTSISRYNILKNYESYQRNVRGRSNSSLQIINKILRQGCAQSSLSKTDYEYLQILTSLSVQAKNAEPNTVTLSTWFELPWLRSILGETEYLLLESPKLLIKSFRITIATTLLFLLHQREQWSQYPSIEFQIKKGSGWQNDWNRILLKKIGNFDRQGKHKDELSHILWLDLVRSKYENDLKIRMGRTKNHDLPRHLGNNEKIYPWQNPVFFHPDNQTQYSLIEELLCSWLIASDTVQPSDVIKLRTTNFVFERNQSDRLLSMECTYYKGRSAKIMRPAIIMGNDVSARALDKYMKGLHNTALFKQNLKRTAHFSISGPANNYIKFLYKIWKTELFVEYLNAELIRGKSTKLFLNAFLAIEHGDKDFTYFYNHTRKNRADYKAFYSKPLPITIFSRTHIKNTAVHSGTDAYRESDLINHNSHSSITEKTKYLTDSNKEWVNQAGRITRLVLHDLQHVAFKPSVDNISLSVSELEVRTKVIQATQAENSRIHSPTSFPTDTDQNSMIIVSDTVDTALYFIHYIDQAELMLPSLITARPDWVERTLIVNVEWMTRTLSRLKSSAVAQRRYKKLSQHLPPLFAYLLETTK